MIHYHPLYGNCGAESPVTTDFRHVTCPECRERFRFELVEPIINSIKTELIVSYGKHGEWQGYTLAQMMGIIHDELDEAYKAAGIDDIDGPHGVKAELKQVAAMCLKTMVKLGYK